MSEGEAADQGAERRQRRRRRRSRGLVASVTLVAAVALVWSQRRDIADDLVAHELAKRGVPARFHVGKLGFGAQQLTNIVIGDPRDPDLVADGITIHPRVRLGGPEIAGVTIGHAVLKARLVDGRVTLGAIDRLMPAPSGKPFALPAYDVRIADLRVRLATDQGPVEIRVAGGGRLDNGFAGRVSAFAGALNGGGCRVDRPRATLDVRIDGGRPSLTGPIAADAIACVGAPGVTAPAARIAATLGERLDSWQGQAGQISAARVGEAGRGFEKLRGTVSFAGDMRRTSGTIDLGGGAFALPGMTGRELHARGRYAVTSAGVEFAGTARAGGAAADRETRALIARQATAAAGTPIGPLVARLASALGAAANDFDVAADLSARGGAISVQHLVANARTGASALLSGGGSRFGAITFGDRLSVRGGDLPALDATIRLDEGGMTGRIAAVSYDAPDARLALTPITIRAAGKTSEVTTVATLSGPLGDGRVEALRLPIVARWRNGGLTLDPDCTAVSWARLTVAGLSLDPARMTLCPTARALVTLTGGHLGGGARLGATNFTGQLGGTPLTLAAAGAEMTLGDGMFSLDRLAARLGPPERLTRIDATRLTGRIESAGIAGRFEGANGQIGQVPLLLSEASGDWRMAGGKLTLAGRLQVADAAEQPRFRPLWSDNVTLTLADNRIEASGALHAPKDASKVADVTLRHDLSRGEGKAALVVPGITFAEKGLQPDDLTPLTFGVIAEVNGRVSGRGDIAWNAEGVTSTGRFATDGLDLAALFGPVTGLKGEIAFSDLLAMVTPPGQEVALATVNPGVPVENGTVRYHLLGPQRVAIEGGRWPFAGGELLLEPTVLDFSAKQVRRMTFRVTKVDAGQFLQQFEFKNLNATGTFDGVLPMVFDENGGRIENGTLTARGAGNLAYVGEVSQKDLGAWGNFAFQALKSLDYHDLGITMNGPLTGEIITEIRFAGLGQGKGAKSNFVIRQLAKLPLVFNVTVRAPFRQLIDSVRSYYDPSLLIQRNLPALIEEQRRREGQTTPTPPTIQPPDSGTVR